MGLTDQKERMTVPRVKLPFMYGPFLKQSDTQKIKEHAKIMTTKMLIMKATSPEFLPEYAKQIVVLTKISKENS